MPQTVLEYVWQCSENFSIPLHPLYCHVTSVCYKKWSKCCNGVVITMRVSLWSSRWVTSLSCSSIMCDCLLIVASESGICEGGGEGEGKCLQGLSTFLQEGCVLDNGHLPLLLLARNARHFSLSLFIHCFTSWIHFVEKWSFVQIIIWWCLPFCFLVFSITNTFFFKSLITLDADTKLDIIEIYIYNWYLFN